MSRNIYVTLGCKIQAINLACPQCLQKVKPQGLYTLHKVTISVSKSFITILFWHFIFSLSLCQIWVLVASHGSYLFLFVASHGFSLCQLLLILWLKVENYVYLSAFQKSVPKVHKISPSILLPHDSPPIYGNAISKMHCFGLVSFCKYYAVSHCIRTFISLSSLSSIFSFFTVSTFLTFP